MRPWSLDLPENRVARKHPALHPTVEVPWVEAGQDGYRWGQGHLVQSFGTLQTELGQVLSWPLAWGKLT